MAQTYLTFTLPTVQSGKVPVYGVEVHSVREIVSRPNFNIASAPGAAPFLMGMVMLRGQLMPVVDLAGALGMNCVRPNLDERMTLLVINEGHQAVAILIDKAMSLVTGELSDSTNLSFETPGLEGVLQDGEQLITIMDLDKLVHAKAAGALVTETALEELAA